MNFRLCCTVLLHLLILLVANGSGARELSINDQTKLAANSNNKENFLRLHSTDVEEVDETTSHFHNKQEVQAPSLHHKNHMDPSLNVFFLLDDLKQGNNMSIYFPRREISSSHLMPKEEADSIPFSLTQLQNLLQLFSFSQDSPQAIAMADTLRECEIEPIKGEIKFCATSLESMIDFAQQMLGTEAQIKAVSTSHIAKSVEGLQRYTILETPEEIFAPKMVACHTMPYPYSIFYCHYQNIKSRVFKVALGNDRGDRVEAAAACHMDTSNWSHSHVSFSILGVQPGSSPVCHFFPADNLIWVPSTLI